MINKKRFRLRMIIPSFPPFNIYSFAANTTTSSGPIYVATAANKLEMWEVEVIDENNLHGKLYPKDENGNIDHYKLQEDRPADVAGFYGSISSSIPRLYTVAKMYKDMGAYTVAGGKHIENMPLEAVNNGIDVAAFGEGEATIRDLLLAWQNETPLENVQGIAFLKNDTLHTTDARPPIEDLDRIAFPDFDLMRYEKMKFYPINRTRGCNANCEFCAVKGKARCASPEWLMAQVKNLVETRNAKFFFESSDHFAADRQEAIRFCRMFADYQKKLGKRFVTTVQLRISDARHPELLEAMRDANINTIAIGYESPIDEELMSMNKGYKSKDLIEWTRTYHKYGFFIHGMFIFGYPKKENSNKNISLREEVKRFKKFIKKAKIDTVQLLLTMPLPGTELRRRLEKENRIYPLEKIGWEYYDGQYPLFEPDDDITPQQLQKAVKDIMSRFYHPRNFLMLAKNMIIHFPGIMLVSLFTLITGRVRYIKKAYYLWKRKSFRNYLLRFVGYFIVKNWVSQFKKSDFRKRLEESRKTVTQKEQKKNLSYDKH